MGMTWPDPAGQTRLGLGAWVVVVSEALARRDAAAPQTSEKAPAAAMPATIKQAPGQPSAQSVPGAAPNYSVPIADASASGTPQSNQTVQLRGGEESPPPDARLQLVLDQYAAQDIPLTAPLIEI